METEGQRLARRRDFLRTRWNVRRLGVALLGGFVSLAAGCRGGATGPGSVPTVASTAPTPAPLPPLASGLLPSLHVVLDDPRLSYSRERARARDYTAAAHAFDDVHGATRVEPSDACAWDYVSGRLHALAGEWAEAETAFGRVVTNRATCPTGVDYAALRAAQAALRGGHAVEAVAFARQVDASLPAHDEAKLALAEALYATDGKAEAVGIWRAHLDSHPRGLRWVDTSTRLASALLDGPESEARLRASEALALTTHVWVDAPKAFESSGAQVLRARALALVGTRAALELSPAERVTLAQGWLDSGDAARAIAELKSIVESALPAKLSDEIRCRGFVLKAQASAKTKGANVAGAWGAAIDACRRSDSLAQALYAGAKASARAKRVEEALDRFGKVEALFPQHRLSDDARLQSALLMRDRGDEEKSEAMLLSLPDSYPQGDMRGEALFRAALSRMVRGDWEGAKAPLDRILVEEKGDRRWATAGRAAYFRARASSATGQKEDALRRYAEILRSVPLAFYMAQAHARLVAEDAPRAAAALEAALREDDAGTFPEREHPELASAAFSRACFLLEVGEVDAAKKELDRAGFMDRSADSELAWIAGDLLNRAGAPEVGHVVGRRASDYLAHYPVGRWRLPWEVAFPRAFEPVVVRESGAHGLSPTVTWAIMREESSFHTEARSPSNAFGLMQLIVPTAQGVARGTPYGSDEAALMLPETSIALGTKLLANLRASYPKHLSLAVAAYNAGGGAVRRWLSAPSTDAYDLWVEQIPYEETRGYVKRVLASTFAYSFLYDRKGFAAAIRLPASIQQ